MTERGNRSNVDDFEQRVSRSLDPDEPRIRAKCATRRLQVGHVDKGKLETQAGHDSLKETIRAAIDIIANDDVRATREHQEQSRDGAHAGRKGQAELAAFKRGE